MQRFRTVLAWRDHLVENIAGVLIVTAAQLVQTWDLHPETCHLLLHGHVQLRRKGRREEAARCQGAIYPKSILAQIDAKRKTEEGDSWRRKGTSSEGRKLQVEKGKCLRRREADAGGRQKKIIISLC